MVIPGRTPTMNKIRRCKTDHSDCLHLVSAAVGVEAKLHKSQEMAALSHYWDWKGLQSES